MLSQGGLWPRSGAILGQKGPFRGMLPAGVNPVLWGAEELVPIGPEKTIAARP